MTWLFTQVWLFSAAAFVLGALITWLLFVRPLRRKLRHLARYSEELRAAEPVHDNRDEAARAHGDADRDERETGWDHRDETLTEQPAPAASDEQFGDEDVWTPPSRETSVVDEAPPFGDTAGRAETTGEGFDEPRTTRKTDRRGRSVGEWPELAGGTRAATPFEPGPREPNPPESNLPDPGPAEPAPAEPASPESTPVPSEADAGTERLRTPPLVDLSGARTRPPEPEPSTGTASIPQLEPEQQADATASWFARDKDTPDEDAEQRTAPEEHDTPDKPRSLFEPLAPADPADYPSASERTRQIELPTPEQAAEPTPEPTGDPAAAGDAPASTSQDSRPEGSPPPLPRRTPGAGPRPGRQNLGIGVRPQHNDAASPPVKGHFASRLYHTPDSPHYDRLAAEVSFNSAAEAEKAGFAPWDGWHRD